MATPDNKNINHGGTATTATKQMKDDNATDNNDPSSSLVQDMKSVNLKAFQVGKPFWYFSKIYDAFNVIQQRPAPPHKKQHHHLRLITIRFSHYCEKVRWGLDLLEAEEENNDFYYTEDAHPPGLHYLETVRASLGQASATPMVIDGSESMTQSHVILQTYCSQLLYPNESVKVWEQDLDQRLGASIRAWCYYYILDDAYWNLLTKMAVGFQGDDSSVPWVEQMLLQMMKPQLMPILRKDLNLGDPTVPPLAKTTIRTVFEDVSKQLVTKDPTSCRSYIVGNTFTAADLTFAALAAPLIQPPEMSNIYGEYQGDVDHDKTPTGQQQKQQEKSSSRLLLPLPMREFQKELRATAAGQHALRMYREHRFSATKPQQHSMPVVIKTARRNRFTSFAVMTTTAAVFAAGAAVMLATTTTTATSDTKT